MRNFLLFLFFSVNLFCQKLDSSDFLILEGESTETVYELNEKGQAFPVSKRVYRPGEVCAADEPDIHRVSNDGDGELINLHVYTPPLHAFNVYDPE